MINSGPTGTLLPWVLPLALLLACEAPESKIERRDFKRQASENAQSKKGTSNAEDKSVQKDAPSIEIDPDFDPVDPNSALDGLGEEFPKVPFALEGLPSIESDRNLIAAAIQADASLSHYAYKLENSNTCQESGGYRVERIDTPLKLDLSSYEPGLVFLCAIAFHFPSKQWQALEAAQVYSWEKKPFQRSFQSYYESLDPQCNQTIRFNAELTIEGSTGRYTWTQQRTPGCFFDGNSYTDLISNVEIKGLDVTGLWYEGEVVAGWFRFRFTDESRTAFTGKWGYGELDGEEEGVWNSSP